MLLPVLPWPHYAFLKERIMSAADANGGILDILKDNRKESPQGTPQSTLWGPVLIENSEEGLRNPPLGLWNGVSVWADGAAIWEWGRGLSQQFCPHV